MEKLNDLPFDSIAVLTTDDAVVYRAKLHSDNDADAWLARYEACSNTKWIVRKTYPNLEKLVHRKDYLCHHSSFAKSSATTKKSKNVHCGATMTLKIYKKGSREEFAKVRHCCQ